jgi:hypothetical protein
MPMLRVVRPFALAAILALGAHALEPLPPLAVVPNDTLILRNGDRLTGKVVETKPDGTLIFLEIGRSKPLPFARDLYEVIEPSQTAAQSVENRGKAQLARKDARGLRETVAWGRANNAGAAALALALQANKLFPADNELGGHLIALLREQDRVAEIEPIATSMLAASPMHEPAYEALALALKAQNRTADLAALTDRFLAVRPTSPLANRLKAELAESKDPRAALEAYRKGWELHKDLDAAEGYARLALRLGQYQGALKAATALAQDPKHAEAAQVIAGSAQLGLGDHAAARVLLTQAAERAEALEPELAQWTRYNLGLALFRGGDRAGARQQWIALDVPAAKLAVAMLDRKPADESAFAGQPRVRDVARDHNACIALQNHQADKALAGLDTKGNARHQYLAEIAAVLKTSGSEASLRPLARTDTRESLRWRAYGLLLARKYADAEALLAKLPANDGWAAVYRVYAAAGQNDAPRAKELFRQIEGTLDAPPDYVALLAAEYAADNDEVFNEEFDWADAEALASGWQAQALETNIRVHAAGGALVFEGTQTASSQPVTRAWRMVPADRLRQVEAVFDIAAIASAQAGIEITDDQRQVGLAYAILADNKLGFRQLRAGTWGQWQTLPLGVEGTKPTLRVDVTAGRAFAVQVDKPTQRYALGDGGLPTTGFLALGVFGVADPGVAWKVGVEKLDVQLKPTVKR